LKRKLCALILDSDKEYIKYAQDQLNASGILTDATEDPETADRLMRKNNYDVVIADHNIVGWDLPTHIKYHMNYNPSLKFVILTIFTKEAIKRCMQLVNVHTVLDKATVNGDLAERIKMVINSKV